MKDEIKKYYITWKIPLITGRMSPLNYSEVKRGRGCIKKFKENSAEIELYKKSIKISFYVESIDPLSAYLEMNSRLHNLYLVLEVRYECKFGGFKLAKTNIPKEVINLMDIPKRDHARDFDKMAIYV